MSTIITVRLDLAKPVFQTDGGDASGRSASQEAEAGSDPGFLRAVAALRRDDKSLRRRPLLVPRDRQNGPCGATDSVRLRTALRDAP
jgi:hypothetical protein